MNGQRFTTQNCGDVIVFDYQNTKNVHVYFVDTGYRLTTSKRVLTATDRPRLRDPLAKTIFGVGRIGIGPHKAHDGSADTHAFSIWRAMLRRCYYAPENRPWRDGCTVSEDWQDFQVFAEWFEANYPKDGERYQLDKDTIVDGNKHYSAANCTFVTQSANLAARRFAKDRVTSK